MMVGWLVISSSRPLKARTSLCTARGDRPPLQYVDDLVEGMIRTMATDDSFIGPVNIGNPNEFTMLELAEAVIRLTNSKSKISFKPLPQDDPKQRQPNINLAKKVLDWEPRVQLDEGLIKTIDYFRTIVK